MVKSKLESCGGKTLVEYLEDPEYLGSLQLIKAAKEILEKNNKKEVILINLQQTGKFAIYYTF